MTMNKVADHETALAPATQRLQAVIDFTFGGSHHVRGLKKEICPDLHTSRGGLTMWSFRVNDGMSTFDFSGLTRLVIAAHDNCVRASIYQSGPRMLKVKHGGRRSNA